MSLASFDELFATVSARDTPAATYTYDTTAYQADLDETLKVLPEIETASHVFPFYSGLTNQIMRFIGIVSLAGAEGYLQFLEPSIKWKDTFGTSDMVSHHKLWDVVHWNSFYPAVPRFVAYDPKYHPHVVLTQTQITTEGGDTIFWPNVQFNTTWDIWENRSITKPAPIGGNLHTCRNTYMQLMRIADKGGLDRDPSRKAQFAVYKEIAKGALKPHPFLQQLVEKEQIKLRSGGRYMTLHARVEPDMARQDRVCVVSRNGFLFRSLDLTL
jgi:hypothetical protein